MLGEQRPQIYEILEAAGNPVELEADSQVNLARRDVVLQPLELRLVLVSKPMYVVPAAFYPDAPGPDPDHARRAAVTDKVAELLGQDRTWTARQLADALGPGVGIGHRQTRRYLGLLRAGYRRTAQTVSHKQDPQKAERAERVLAGLKKKPRRAG
jgi:hypothetical protein